MSEVAFVGIKIVKDNVCVRRAAGSENDDFSEGTEFLDKFQAVRPDTDACLHKMKDTEMMLPPSIGKSSFTV